MARRKSIGTVRIRCPPLITSPPQEVDPAARRRLTHSTATAKTDDDRCAPGLRAGNDALLVEATLKSRGSRGATPEMSYRNVVELGAAAFDQSKAMSCDCSLAARPTATQDSRLLMIGCRATRSTARCWTASSAGEIILDVHDERRADIRAFAAYASETSNAFRLATSIGDLPTGSR